VGPAEREHVNAARFGCRSARAAADSGGDEWIPPRRRRRSVSPNGRTVEEWAYLSVAAMGVCRKSAKADRGTKAQKKNRTIINMIQRTNKVACKANE
jgi:hypothetical protein